MDWISYLLNARTLFIAQTVASLGGIVFFLVGMFLMSRMTFRSGQVNALSILGRFFTCGCGCSSFVFLMFSVLSLGFGIYWYYF